MLRIGLIRRISSTDRIGKQVGGIVIGVVKDFHSRSLREEIGPLAFVTRQSNFHNLAVRIRSESIPETLAFLESQWKVFVPDRPFRSDLVEDQLKQIYQWETRFGQITGIFSIMAILVACLGLFGLASFTAEQRMKEIGIRKVMGASVAAVIVLQSKDFVKWVAIANLIAWPAAYYAMNLWLQDFAYRVSLNPLTFLLATLLALVVALLTVGSQALRAATANPVDALRYE